MHVHVASAITCWKPHKQWVGVWERGREESTSFILAEVTARETTGALVGQKDFLTQTHTQHDSLLRIFFILSPGWGHSLEIPNPVQVSLCCGFFFGFT